MNNPHHRSRPISKGKLSGGSLLLGILAVLYYFLQPVLNERLGWNLPKLGSPTEQAQRADQPSTPAPTHSTDSQSDVAESAKPTNTISNEQPARKDSSTEQDSIAKRDSTPKQESAAKRDSTSKQDSADLLYGLLKEIQPDRYISPEGLLYGPGSEEGHRLKHLERHVKDQPTRPGSHGVFDGGMEAALAAIDEAYARVQKKSSGVTSEEDGRRTIHTVNMGRRVGFVGGAEGKRKRNPQARRLRLVLEGNRVITAFPL